MKVIDCKQGSAEWLQIRVGKVTASRVADVMATLKKGGESAARTNYRIQVVAETLTGMCADSFVSDAMKWGIDQEKFARASYELFAGCEVDQVGFIEHPTIERAGSSPDGIVGDDGGIECKCPNTATHIKWMLAGEVPEEHQPQMFFNMACAGRQWWDFVSYDSRLPERYQLFVKRLHWDAAKVLEIEDGIRLFLSEVDSTIAQLNKLTPDPSPTTAPKKKAELSEALEASLGVTDADIERWYGATP